MKPNTYRPMRFRFGFKGDSQDPIDRNGATVLNADGNMIACETEEIENRASVISATNHRNSTDKDLPFLGENDALFIGTDDTRQVPASQLFRHVFNMSSN
ncbi:MAG TPA: hypothetical protein VMA37_06770 [Acetobacteraceae bacterium]|nr:hypothetical protein [Acetobacteraceae bacterium]